MKQRDVSRIQWLIHELDAAFADTGCPSRKTFYAVRFSEADVLARQFVASGSWRQVPLELLRDGSASLALMSVSAFRYVLAATLRAALLEPIALDVGIDSLIAALTLPSDNKQLHLFESLSSYQRSAVQNVLIYFSEGDDEYCAARAREALTSYWRDLRTRSAL